MIFDRNNKVIQSGQFLVWNHDSGLGWCHCFAVERLVFDESIEVEVKVMDGSGAWRYTTLYGLKWSHFPCWEVVGSIYDP